MRYKLLLAGLGILAAAHAQESSEPKFEVASIKPNHSGDQRSGIAIQPGGRFSATNATTKTLITLAFQLKENQISGLPAWADSERFDISAKPESGAGVKEEAVRAMLRDLLAERFALKFHKETKELPTYALVIARSGSKLQESKGNADLFHDPDSPKPSPPASEGGRGQKGRGIRMGRGEISGANVTVPMIADQLSRVVGRTVIDKTGLAGNYDFDLKYTPEMNPGPAPMNVPEQGKAGEPAPPPDSAPSIFVAVQEQLGLKLESQKGPVDLYVIDRIEKPADN